MTMDNIPVWGIFFATVACITFSIEFGFRFGRMAHRRSEGEKESPASAIVGSTLGLSAFMLAFTFGFATSLFDSRKSLVRDEAIAIQTCYFRADFLPETDKAEAKKIIANYLAARIEAALSSDKEKVVQVISDSRRAQATLWNMAVINAKRDMNSDVAALYIDSLNELMKLHALRVAIGVQARIPIGVWLILFGLIFLGMAGLGYQTGIAGSNRSLAGPILSVAFALVIALIAALDHPGRGLINVSQQPLIDLQNTLAS